MPNLTSFAQTLSNTASCKITNQLKLAFVLLPFLFLTLSACDQRRERVRSPGITEDTILIGSSSALGGHAGFLGSQYTLGATLNFSSSFRWERATSAAMGALKTTGITATGTITPSTSAMPVVVAPPPTTLPLQNQTHISRISKTNIRNVHQ